MSRLSQDIDRLKSYFVSKDGGIVKGELTPDITDTHNLGRANQRWENVYVKTITAEDIIGETGMGNADTVDSYHASQTPFGNFLLALDPQGIFPTTVFPQTLLKDGTRALEGNLAVIAGATIDGVDIGTHTHTGTGDEGAQMTHADLLGLSADDHPQYTQRAQDEIITGDWMFTHLQDRTAGWQFLPDDKVFKAIPGNMTFTASKTPNMAKMEIGPSNEIVIYDDDTPTTYMRVGVANASITLSGTDATYRLWVGNAVPGSAPFRVEKDGSIFATAGEIAGWTIDTVKIFKNDLDLDSSGKIIAGTADDIIQIDSVNATWRIWAGNTDPTLAPFRVNKTGQIYMNDGFVSGTLKSMNFISGQQGFSLSSSGLAEFDEIVARGRLEAVVFAESAISVASGRLMITDGSVLTENMPDTQDYFIVDHPVFLPNDIVRMKPDATRDEWMQVAAPYELVGGAYKYYVVRELNDSEPGYAGPYDYYAGENVARHGSAVQASLAYPLTSGEVGGEYGEYQPGGSGATTSGGYLLLEGSRNFGPYFGVAARYGPVFDQMLDVVRIGNLNGILDYTEEEWGAFFGDANQFMSYDQTQGLRIQFSGGAVDTTIDDAGLTTEILSLEQQGATPAYIDQQARLWHEEDGGDLILKARMKDGATETEITIGDISYGPIMSRISLRA